jgi:hypothetical protein
MKDEEMSKETKLMLSAFAWVGSAVIVGIAAAALLWRVWFGHFPN